MNIQDWDGEKFAKEYEKELLRARRKAGNKVGGKVVKEARRALGKVSPARRKMITKKINKNGNLIHKDRASDARVREYGAVITPKKSQYLRVNFGKEERKKDADFSVKTGSGILLFEGEGKSARPIAVLKKQVRRQPVTNPKKLSKIAADHAAEYFREIENNIEDF